MLDEETKRKIEEKIAEFESLIIEDDLKIAITMMLFMRMNDLTESEAIEEVQKIYKLSESQSCLLIADLKAKHKNLKFKSSFGYGIWTQLSSGYGFVSDPTKTFSLKIITKAVENYIAENKEKQTKIALNQSAQQLLEEMLKYEAGKGS